MSKRPAGARCKLSPAQLNEMHTLLDARPAAEGWAAQCWTLARINAVVRERFGVDHTLAGLDLLLHRPGWSVQVPPGGPLSAPRSRSPPGGSRPAPP